MSAFEDDADRFGLHMAMPTAWQATADNKVTRHYNTAATPIDATTVNAHVALVEQKLAALRTQVKDSSIAADTLAKAIDTTIQRLKGPGSELATAQQALIDLKKRNDALIRECRRWKARAETAEKQAEEALEQAQKQAETPEAVFFIRRRTPGDSVRYLAGEVMKHAEGNLELAGVAMALKMVAADFDSLPQGTR